MTTIYKSLTKIQVVFKKLELVVKYLALNSFDTVWTPQHIYLCSMTMWYLRIIKDRDRYLFSKVYLYMLKIFRFYIEL